MSDDDGYRCPVCLTPIHLPHSSLPETYGQTMCPVGRRVVRALIQAVQSIGDTTNGWPEGYPHGTAPWGHCEMPGCGRAVGDCPHDPSSVARMLADERRRDRE